MYCFWTTSIFLCNLAWHMWQGEKKVKYWKKKKKKWHLRTTFWLKIMTVMHIYIFSLKQVLITFIIFINAA